MGIRRLLTILALFTISSYKAFAGEINIQNYTKTIITDKDEIKELLPLDNISYKTGGTNVWSNLTLYEEKGTFKGILTDRVKNTVDTLENVGIYDVLSRIGSLAGPAVRIEVAKHKHIKIKRNNAEYELSFDKIKRYILKKKNNENEKDLIFIELLDGKTIETEYIKFNGDCITGTIYFSDMKSTLNKPTSGYGKKLELKLLQE